ncbi:MAG: hypothetical protein JO142_20290 [Burkholderiales bacterium]|nr:hypothetical protein [Burkholderiales bacterium]
MQPPFNLALVAGAVLSTVAALLHIGCIIGGPPWYRFFGAGERMARAAERGSVYPTLITTGIVAVLFAWAAYALSAAGVIAHLPLLKFAIVAITVVYLMRGLVLVPVLLAKPKRVTPFIVWSSLICIGYGAIHLLGVAQVWSQL